MRVRDGHLKIVLGYAAGVGKTYQMLTEGQQLSADGHDVVLGYFEPHSRKDTIARAVGLETIPRRKIAYRGHLFEEMDVDAILQRRPEICLVDEFPHTNVPGSGRAKRWEDVIVLLEAGIDVITTMNIQHLESLNDQVRMITGIGVRETIPDWVVKRADIVVFADLTPGALLNRLDRGVIYSPEKAGKARENFFKEGTLAALRELALRQTAHELEMRQSQDMTPPTAAIHPFPGPPETILIHLSDVPETAAVIRRGRRVADYLQGDCLALLVLPEGGWNVLSEASRAILRRHVEFARGLQIPTRILESSEVAEQIVAFAKTNGVTQIMLAQPRLTRLSPFGKKPVAMEVIQMATDVQVTVIARGRPDVTVH